MLTPEEILEGAERVRRAYEHGTYLDEVMDILSRTPGECHGFEAPNYEGSPIIQPRYYAGAGRYPERSI